MYPHKGTRHSTVQYKDRSAGVDVAVSRLNATKYMSMNSPCAE